MEGGNKVDGRWRGGGEDPNKEKSERKEGDLIICMQERIKLRERERE